MSELCLHTDFATTVRVAYLEDIQRWSAEIRIECTQCHEPFVFVGVPAGFDLFSPRTSIDGRELRVPIAPQGDKVQLAGMATYRGPRGFGVRERVIGVDWGQGDSVVWRCPCGHTAGSGTAMSEHLKVDHNVDVDAVKVQ